MESRSNTTACTNDPKRSPHAYQNIMPIQIMLIRMSRVRDQFTRSMPFIPSTGISLTHNLMHNHPTSLGRRERQGDAPCTPAGEIPCTPFSHYLRCFCIKDVAIVTGFGQKHKMLRFQCSSKLKLFEVTQR